MNDVQILRQFLSEYLSDNMGIPSETLILRRNKEDAQILRQFLSDCRAWLPDDLKAAIKAAIAAIEGQNNGT